MLALDGPRGPSLGLVRAQLTAEPTLHHLFGFGIDVWSLDERGLGRSARRLSSRELLSGCLASSVGVGEGANGEILRRAIESLMKPRLLRKIVPELRESATASLTLLRHRSLRWL